MYRDHSIAVIVPCHNEERHVSHVIQTMPYFVDQILVIDDNSADDTSGAARACDDPRVILIRTQSSHGVGGATILGYEKALALGTSLMVKMDGDGQMDPKYLAGLLDPLIEDGYDYTKGNRFLAGDSLSSMPRHRLIGNVVLTFMTKLASGYWHIFDPQNGYTAITERALKALDLSLVHRRFFFENDMLVGLNFHRFRVKDVAIPSCYGQEESDIKLFRIVTTFPFLLLRRFFRRIYQRYVLRDFSPVALFLFLGLALFGWGSLFGVYLWIETALTGRATPTGTIMLALLPLILGFQLILQAIVLDIQDTPR